MRRPPSQYLRNLWVALHYSPHFLISLPAIGQLYSRVKKSARYQHSSLQGAGPEQTVIPVFFLYE
jgi:hypothetical protein